MVHVYVSLLYDMIRVYRAKYWDIRDVKHCILFGCPKISDEETHTMDRSATVNHDHL